MSSFSSKPPIRARAPATDTACRQTPRRVGEAQTPDFDIHRSAKLVVDKYADQAVAYAAGKIDLLTEAGDAEGASIWRAIMAEIEELQRGRREGERLN